MPYIEKIPRDAIYLTANDKDDFLKWAENWTRNGWLLSSDFDRGLYSAIAMKDARIMILLWKDPQYVVEIPIQAESEELRNPGQTEPSDQGMDVIEKEEAEATAEAMAKLGH